MAQWNDCALMRFLETKAPLYYGKITEVRDEVKGWLSYVPQTFPHYTRHTIEHSDEIVSQVSKLLFRNNDPAAPVLPNISALELYILVVAAFLHDAGMVASDAEKLQILESAEWRSWVETGSGATRWKAIQTFADGAEPADPVLRQFLGDIQRRFLIAEFIRRSHHVRAGDVVRQHHDQFGRLAFGDPSLLNTIAEVCVAHGLNAYELDDKARFPDERDIRNETVNVRLMAILLRLGDLLDMIHDRACPLLLNAACPLPADSYAHWTQYQRITHRLTNPDRIEITAECMEQDEHRYLYDWCRWLVEERRHAALVMMRSTRHGGWQPPLAELEGESPTITIRPHKAARYFPSKWTFELDRDAVFQRLIYDAYAEPKTFLRELVQNAADANRCALIDALKSDGREIPVLPTRAPEADRKRFPITVTVSTVERTNAMSGEKEERQVITISDNGIGMDRYVIEHYFLQVGRSYYITEEFRRKYDFVPTSRFGIGFLSTFAVSDNVEVETFKREEGAKPIHLRLTGPRSYLLTEHGSRTRTGTDVSVEMRMPIPEDEVLEALRHWCKRLEFAVVVKLSNRTETIVAETAPDFVREAGPIRIRAFPVASDTLEGELYVSEYLTENGPSWNPADIDEYLEAFPLAQVPETPRPMSSLNGVNLIPLSANPYIEYMYALAIGRIDFRGKDESLNLSRVSAKAIAEKQLSTPVIRERWIEIFHEHLATAALARGESGWQYVNALAMRMPLRAIWDAVPDFVPVEVDGRRSFFSLIQLQSAAVLAVQESTVGQADFEPVSSSLDGIPFLSRADRQYLAHAAATVIDNMAIREVVRTAKGLFSIREAGKTSDAIAFCPAPADLIALTSFSRYEGRTMINTAHPLGQWIQRCHQERNALDGVLGDAVQRLMRHLENFSYGTDDPSQFATLETSLRQWNDLPGLPSDLRVPDIPFSPRNFAIYEED